SRRQRTRTRTTARTRTTTRIRTLVLAESAQHDATCYQVVPILSALLRRERINNPLVQCASMSVWRTDLPPSHFDIIGLFATSAFLPTLQPTLRGLVRAVPASTTTKILDLDASTPGGFRRPAQRIGRRDGGRASAFRPPSVTLTTIDNPLIPD